MLKAKDKEEIDKIMKNDPFILEEIAEYEIIEFNVANLANGLKDFFS